MNSKNKRASVDFRRVAAAALGAIESLLREWLPGGHREGHEYKALNPTRADGRPGSFSVNITTGAWGDFATDDKGGDAISLYAYLQGISQLQAAKAVAEQLGIAAAPAGAQPRVAKASAESEDEGATSRRTNWRPITPVPADAPEPPKAHVKRRFPEASWTYRNQAGEVLGLIYRFKTSDGGKEILPCSFAENAISKAREWRWLAFAVPRPLYGLPALDARPVLLVEGEKCADAATEALGAAQAPLAVLTWPGGSKAVDKVDWTPLAGRSVLIWPDCDAQRDKKTQAILPQSQQPGVKAAARIAELLAELVPPAKVKILEIPKPGEKPGGWDIADAIGDGMTRDELLEYMRSRQRGVGSRAMHLGSAEDLAAALQRSEELAAAGEGFKLILDSKDRVLPIEANASVIIKATPHLDGLHYDSFLDRIRFNASDQAIRDWTDDDDIELLEWLQRNAGMPGLKLPVVQHASRRVAYERRRDSLRDFWLEGVPPHDGTARIAFALCDAWGAADTEVNRASSHNLLRAMAARAITPGAKVDQIWVFEGPQGRLKSTALEALGGEFYAEIAAPIGSADFIRETRGAMLAELGELSAMRGREAQQVKQVLSRRTDRYVEKYEKHPREYLRRCVFVGTTNDEMYWGDPTGARRLVPIRTGEISIEVIRSNRLQWFAEALADVRSGATWHEWPAQVDQEREKRQDVDPWESTLADLIENGRVGGEDGMGVEDWPEGKVLSADIMRYWLRLSPHQQGQSVSARLGKVMRRLGYRPTTSGHEKQRAWELDPQRADAVVPPRARARSIGADRSRASVADTADTAGHVPI